MDMILKNTFQSISPAYELIGDVTVGTNTTQVDFTGLNIGKDDELLLVSDINCSGFTIAYELTINGNDTRTNYYYQELNARNTSLSSGRANNPMFLYVPNSNLKSFCIASLKLANSGYFVCQSRTCGVYGGSSVELNTVFTTTNFTASSVTSFKIKASATNGIGIGSRFQLYKLVAEKVADIIVPSNTTSVDITGLNIGKDGEYYLVSDILNNVVSDSFYLYANANYTNSQYYAQELGANGTGVNGGRSNNSIFSYCGTVGDKALVNSNIKLTNSGYFIYQANGCKGYGGSGVLINKFYGTSTGTISSIAALRIASSQTNGIGANSRFTLYKMK